MQGIPVFFKQSKRVCIFRIDIKLRNKRISIAIVRKTGGIIRDHAVICNSSVLCQEWIQETYFKFAQRIAVYKRICTGVEYVRLIGIQKSFFLFFVKLQLLCCFVNIRQSDCGNRIFIYLKDREDSLSVLSAFQQFS